MKFIDEIVKNPWSEIDSVDEPSIPTASLQILNGIAKDVSRPADTNVDRCSSANNCPKQRWYKRRGYPGKPMAPRSYMVFAFGDLVEAVCKHFVRQHLVGLGKLYSEVVFGDEIGSFPLQGTIIKIYSQQTVSFVLDGGKITGHYDGLGKRNSDGKWELLEFKSYSNFGFGKFKAAGPEDYLQQAHALMLCDELKALEVEAVRFFGFRKETSHIWDSLHHYDQAIADRVIEEFRAVRSDEEMEPPYGFVSDKKGKKALYWKCSYCAYTNLCHGDLKVEFTKANKAGSQKPVFTKEDDSKVIPMRIAPQPTTTAKDWFFKTRKDRK